MRCRNSKSAVRQSAVPGTAHRPAHSKLGVFLLVALCLTLIGCAGLPRRPNPPVGVEDSSLPGFQETVRYVAGSQAAYRKRPQRVAVRLLEANGERPLNMLVLSGGGAGGSFGAGALVGWSQQGTRPEFDIVTGVSAGALYAPYAFLGSSWDDRLIQAFPQTSLERLLQRSLLTAIFGTSLYRGKPLHDLVDRFVTADLLRAVARESARGRLLLVATTDLDTQATVIWDLGAIAREGDDHARQLFRDVLIAAASIPGIFPPVMIQVQRGGSAFEEMHADGATTAALFIAPEAALFPEQFASGLRGSNLYVIINGQLGGAPETTKVATLPIIKRGLDAMVRSALRSNFALVYGFAIGNGMNVHVAYIPDQYPYGEALDFRYGHVRALFDYGQGCAAGGELWSIPGDVAAHAVQAGLNAVSDHPRCPAEAAVQWPDAGSGSEAVQTADTAP